MTVMHDLVVLIDVDNTLLDNDRFTADLGAHLSRETGDAGRERYWQVFEELRKELGYADYLGALQRFRSDARSDPRLPGIADFLLNYPFASRLYPEALAVLTKLSLWGTTVILSDGDVVFQPRKIQRSGIWNAVEGRVLLYVHKENMLSEVERLYPARHYLMVDDKLRILAAMKQVWGSRLSTIFVRQGHYATDPAQLAAYPMADLAVDHIADLLACDKQSPFGTAAGDDSSLSKQVSK